MEQHGETESASLALKRVIEKNTADLITLYELKTSFHERGFGFMLLLFSFPLPVVPPGIVSFLVIPVFMVAIQMLFGLDAPWLPKWLGKRSVKRTTLAAAIEKTAPYLHRAERLLKPRLHFVSSERGERVIGFAAVIFSITIATPFPLSNFWPAIGIIVMALGLLSRDGLVILIGMVIGLIGVILTTIATVLGLKILEAIFFKITAFFGF